MSVTAVIPTIPPRRAMLTRALTSVSSQTYPTISISIAVDHHHEGAAETRNRALQAARTEWVAFLDDDDEWLPEHVGRLLWEAMEADADYVFSYYTVRDAHGELREDIDPLGNFGKPFNPKKPHQTTITTLVRTELAQWVGFHAPEPGLLIHGNKHGEDFQFTLDCVKAGAKIVHLPVRTWIWDHHGGNTAGEPGRW